jgi:hypothetical protein
MLRELGIIYSSQVALNMKTTVTEYMESLGSSLPPQKTKGEIYAESAEPLTCQNIISSTRWHYFTVNIYET